MFQLVEEIPVIGYKLFDLGSYFELKHPRGSFRGDLKRVCSFAVIELGFDLKEINIGILEMGKMGHNCAEFGAFKRFMFTFEAFEKNAKITIH